MKSVVKYFSSKLSIKTRSTIFFFCFFKKKLIQSFSPIHNSSFNNSFLPHMILPFQYLISKDGKTLQPWALNNKIPKEMNFGMQQVNFQNLRLWKLHLQQNHAAEIFLQFNTQMILFHFFPSIPWIAKLAEVILSYCL